MAGLSDTLVSLAQFRKGRGAGAAPAGGTELPELTGLRDNPGALRMLAHVPNGLPAHAPLVVVLHGCAQTAGAYDAGAGWSMLADRHGFAMLYPEQVRGNNANLCFNWFQPEEVARIGGEVQSIRQGIAHMVASHRLAPARVYVTGLSAGGAMATAMLAAYPEVFAGGAVIAGLPFGAAGSVQGAFEAMFQGRTRTPRHWGDLVRDASPHAGPWPAVQVWHGNADSTVKPSNAEELLRQWGDVLGLPPSPNITDTVDGAAHRAWRNASGKVVLEAYIVSGLAHGVPLDTGNADLDRASGQAGPYMLEAGIGSTWHIARSWGLLTASARAAYNTPADPVAAPKPNPLAAPRGPATVIDKALRAAGLLGRG